MTEGKGVNGDGSRPRKDLREGTTMKLTGELKKQVEKAETKEEKKGLIENAGMLLDDVGLDQVAGGSNTYVQYEVRCYFPNDRPGCTFKQLFHNEKQAEYFVESKKGKCPGCRIGILKVKERIPG